MVNAKMPMATHWILSFLIEPPSSNDSAGAGAGVGVSTTGAGAGAGVLVLTSVCMFCIVKLIR
jgi:hypothetical protein